MNMNDLEIQYIRKLKTLAPHNKPQLGKPHSQEVRDKISAFNRGKKLLNMLDRK
jgi:hypothetical protein